MLKKCLFSVACLMVLATVVVMETTAGGALAGDLVPRMKADQLLEKLDSPDVMIIDVRLGRDWEGSVRMIKNSVRRPYDDVESWIGELPDDKTIVLYCA